MSDANASACRSNISLTCSANESGTPIGAPGSSRGSPLLLYASTFWMRRSISRTFVEVVVQPRAVARRRGPCFSRATDAGQPVEDALVLGAPLAALARRRADAEQLIEDHARVAHHRQRLRRRRPADRVGVGARVAVGAAARLVHVLDAQLHRRNRRVLPESSARRSGRARCRRSTSEPCVCFGCICVRNTALERKWSPPISGAVNASALRTSVLLTIVRWSRNGSSGLRLLGDRSKSRPTPAGAHMFFLMPNAVLPADAVHHLDRRRSGSSAARPSAPSAVPPAPSPRGTAAPSSRRCPSGRCGGTGASA